MNEWQIATLIRAEPAAAHIRSLFFRVPNWIKPRAGQHYDVRTTGETQSEYERNYSVANTPEDEQIIELGVELFENGVVSPRLWNMTPGETIEVNGPKGGHFVWDATMSGPLVMIAGGAGVVPMMSMVRHHFRNHRSRTVTLLISARTLSHVPYRAELESYAARDPNFKLAVTLTREAPNDWNGYARRVDESMLRETLRYVRSAETTFYVAGPNGFTDGTMKSLIRIGFSKRIIRTEQFGGSV